MQNKTNFHLKNFVLTLALMMRFTATRKCYQASIQQRGCSANYLKKNVNKDIHFLRKFPTWV